MLSVGSLFSGIGGFDLGLERAGFRTAWFCEQDEFCQRVLAKHWPGVPCYPDVRELTGASVAPVDVLCGGFPCQDISLAGKGAGLDGARSGLWSEYARLIRELEPRWVIVENVSALLGRGLDRVLRDLAALGYDAEWDCIPASAVGAPHQRDRIWIVAYPQREQLREQPGRRSGPSGASPSLVAVDGSTQPMADPEGESEWSGLRASEPRRERRGRSGDGRCAPRDVANTDEFGCPGGICVTTRGDERSRSGDVERGSELQDADECALQSWRVGGRAAQAGGPEWWSAEPPVGRVAHGVPDRLDQLAALGNALVPQIAEWIGHRIMSYEESR